MGVERRFYAATIRSGGHIDYFIAPTREGIVEQVKTKYAQSAAVFTEHVLQGLAANSFASLNQGDTVSLSVNGKFLYSRMLDTNIAMTLAFIDFDNAPGQLKHISTGGSA